jgi:aldehyde dehydrogenase
MQMADAEVRLDERMIIGGERVVGGSGRWVAVENPAHTAEVVGRVPVATAADVDRAVAAARAAGPEWAALGARARAERLGQAAAVLEQLMPQETALLTRENGKILAESYLDFGFTAQMLGYFASLADRLEDELVISDGLGRSYLRRKPKGVVAAIVPWNYPIVLAFFKIAPALLAGNTLVVKPASYAPLTLTRVLAAVGALLPPGVLNVVTGPGGEVGEALARHPGVAMVAFTGGTDVGKTVMAAAAGGVKDVLLELGGNDAAVILDDFPLEDEALGRRLLRGVFNHTGQICFDVKRIYVPGTLYDRFVRWFEELADTLVVGDGLHPAVTMGPLNNRPGWEFVRGLIAESRAQGARVTTVGRMDAETAATEGYYQLPTVVSEIGQGARLVQVEQFGPVIPLVRYETLEEGIAQANDTPYGLCGSVWTGDEERGLAVAGRLEAGSVFVNSHEPFSLDPRLPFGGVKESGIGRALSPAGLDAYVDFQVVSTRYYQPQGQ